MATSLKISAKMRLDRVMQTRWQLVFVVVLLAGWAARLFRLDSQSLWLDELGQASAASRGLMATIEGSQKHLGAAPLDYMVTWLALQIAHVDFAVRFPAAFFGTLTIAVLFWLGRELFTLSVAALAGTLLALAPLHLRYSQEVRPYALFTCLAMATSLALILALKRQTAVRWGIYGLLAAAALYCHYYAALLFVGYAAIVALVTIWPRFFPLAERGAEAQTDPDQIDPISRLKPVLSFVLVSAAAGVAFLPWYFYAVRTEGATPWAALPEFTVGQFGQAFADLILGPDFTKGSPLLLVLVALLTGAGVAAGFWHRRWRVGTVLCTINLLLVPPIVVAILRSSRYFFHVRQIAFLLPLLLLLAALGLVRLASLLTRWLQRRSHRTARVASAGVAAVTLLLLVGLWRPAVENVYQTQRQNWRDAFAFISANAGPSQTVAAPFLDTSSFYYYFPSADKIATPDSLDELRSLAEKSSASWVLTIPYTALVSQETVDWLVGSDAVRVNFGAIAVAYLSSDQSLAESFATAKHWSVPDNRYAFESLASGFQVAGMTDEAVALLERAANLATDRQQMSLYKTTEGRYWQTANERERAVQAYQEAVSLWPENTDAGSRLGSLLLALGRFDEAQLALERVLAVKPDDYWANRHLSDIRAQQGRLDEAVSLLRNAIAIDPSIADSHFRLGNLLGAVGDAEAAVAAYRRYLELDPQGPRAAESQTRIRALTNPTREMAP